MAESQAGHPASRCSPRAVLANPGPGTLHNERERLYRQAGCSAGAVGCSAFPVASSAAAGAGGSGTGRGGLAMDAAMGRSSPVKSHGGRAAATAGRCWARMGGRGRSLLEDLHRRCLMGELERGRIAPRTRGTGQGIGVERMRRLRLMVGSGLEAEARAELPSWAFCQSATVLLRSWDLTLVFYYML